MHADTFAPGARVLIRDEEWMIRRVQHARAGSALHVVGLSELVRNQEALFLTELDDVEVLRAEDTTLVRDDSAGHRQARLYLEALLRRSPPTDHRLVIGHQGAIRHTPYQWDPAAQALKQMRPRILMADGVGLGKTIEVGILLSELIRRGRGQRILVVALKSILAQFQAELWARFTIPLVRLDSVGIQRVQAKIPTNQNPFHYFDKVIVSIDTLKKQEKYRRYLDDCHWDAIVIDECQNVAERGSNRSRRAALARILARNTDALVLTSATPHDGRAESFASLMRLLEPTAIADESAYKGEDIRHLFIRRFQKDVRKASRGNFHKRDAQPLVSEATPPEDHALAVIDRATFRTIGRSGSSSALFQTVLRKAWLSSPEACISTVDERLRRLQKKEDKGEVDAKALVHDRRVLGDIRTACTAVTPDQQSKLSALIDFLAGLGYRSGTAGERVVIFSERIDTLDYLADQLGGRFGLATTGRWNKDPGKWTRGPIARFHGGMPDQEQYALVQDFTNKNGTVRVLLGSDAASEGLNLHHACHHLLHYDIPWSLITVEQRNGRIDRFGQDAQPTIRYLLTRPADESLRSDFHILERLTEKANQAAENLGEVSWQMNLHSVEKEEARITRAIEDHEAPDAPYMHGEDDDDDDEGDDWLAEVLGMDDDDDDTTGTAETTTPLTVFADDLAYAREGFAQLGLDGEQARVDWFDDLDGFRLSLPPDLQFRYRYLPPELRRGRDNELRLTTSRKRVMDAYDRARDTEDGWPEWELFWQQHPVAEWLNDRVLASFRRHEAPIVEVRGGLDPGESAYIFQSILSNERSQPVLVDWSAVRRQRLGTLVRVPFSELSEATGLHDALPNTGRTLPIERLQKDLPRAVELVRERLVEARTQHERAAATTLRPEIRKLRKWQAESKDRLAQIQETMLIQRTDRTRALERERQEIDAIYAARQAWIKSTIRVSPTPHIRLAAVLVCPA